MSIIRKVNYRGFQNVENLLSEEFKKVGKHDLEEVTRENGILTLTFSDEENEHARNFVKQVSKKKNENLSAFFRRAPRHWRLLKVIEDEKMFLLFFSEKCREGPPMIM